MKERTYDAIDWNTLILTEFRSQSDDFYSLSALFALIRYNDFHSFISLIPLIPYIERTVNVNIAYWDHYSYPTSRRDFPLLTLPQRNFSASTSYFVQLASSCLMHTSEISVLWSIFATKGTIFTACSLCSNLYPTTKHNQCKQHILERFQFFFI